MNIQNKSIARFGLTAGVAILVGAGSSFATYKVMAKKKDNVNATLTHKYYEVNKRLHAFEKVVNTLSNSDEIFEAVNNELTSPSDEEEDDGEEVDDSAAKEVSTVAPTDLGKATNLNKVPYHMMYGTQIVDRSIEDSDQHLDDPRPPELILDEQDTWSNVPQEKPPDPMDQQDPYVISQDECGDSNNDVECLIYYDGDGTLANEMEEALNISDYIGEENLDKFVDGLLYIRNNRFGMDYEVRWDLGSFSRDILQFHEDDYIGGRMEMKNRGPRNREEFK